MEFVLALACFTSWLTGTQLLSIVPPIYVSVPADVADLPPGDEPAKDDEDDEGMVDLLAFEAAEDAQALGHFLTILAIVIAYFAGRYS